MRRLARALLVVSALVGLLPAMALASDDWDVQQGRFYTQTGGGWGNGYAVSDQDGIPFWSAFHRLGGVAGVGYPISQRFTWGGFTVQAFQRVVLQWRPDVRQVYLVNLLDCLSEAGFDDWLLAMRQTPRPLPLDERGMEWGDIVASRLALLDDAPAIRREFFDASADPVYLFGLPTSPATDVGNHIAVRTQRAVFQLWKEDVPWARAGTVTVALAGDIAKETGLLPYSEALLPRPYSGTFAAPLLPLPTATPTPTAPAVPTPPTPTREAASPTPTPTIAVQTNTPTPVPPTSTSTATLFIPPTFVATGAPASPTPAPDTPTPTATLIASPTTMPVGYTPTPTSTRTPTPSPSPTGTPTITATPTQTSTPTETTTPSPMPTSTHTPTS